MLDTPHKKKSLLITILLHMVLLLIMFFFGMTYLDPAEEQGIAVNFGTTDIGSGRVQPTEPVKTAPVEEVVPEEVEEEVSEEDASEATPDSEEVVTQEDAEAPVIKEEKKEKKAEIEKEVPKKETKTKEVKKEKEQPVKKEKPKPVEKKPDASTKSALDSFLNGPKNDGKAKGGEGDDATGGDKGRPDGDPNAKSYYGNGKGLDGDGNYRLGGRKALNKEKKIPVCNETGTVVVKIVVDKTGKVIQAYPGIKGTTNTAPCLMKPAKEAAMATRFNSDEKAPSKQTGSIVYTFKLSE
ncbi:hypothetical protein [Aquimarina agarilytica]|uniref:hypothetical protein n=1 Tax=Aquimarina agarilytica TaxID=1087449 RepID=UPI0002883763